MRLKVNTGDSFLHPVTNQMIGPGQFYQDYEIESPKKSEGNNELTENNQDQNDTNESTGGEKDGQGETNTKSKKGSGGQRGTTGDK